MSKFPQKRTTRFNSVTVGEVHTNVSQEVIEITSDKLKIILLEYLDSLHKSNAWQVPLSLVITIALVLTTANFKKFMGFEPDAWAALFLMSFILSIIWLIWVLFTWKKAMTIEDILTAVKNKT